MIQCPNCKHQELPGALFCSECGTQLVVADTLTAPLGSQNNDNFSFDENVPATGPAIKETNSPFKDTVLSLHVVNYNKTLRLAGRNEYSMGRVAKGQPILPDFDLSEFDAYNNGVSRLHAVIKCGVGRVSIMDLGSANGTRVNGQKIAANVEYPLKNGDLIAFGKLKIEFSMTSD